MFLLLQPVQALCNCRVGAGMEVMGGGKYYLFNHLWPTIAHSSSQTHTPTPRRRAANPSDCSPKHYTHADTHTCKQRGIKLADPEQHTQKTHTFCSISPPVGVHANPMLLKDGVLQWDMKQGACVCVSVHHLFSVLLRCIAAGHSLPDSFFAPLLIFQVFFFPLYTQSLFSL